MKAALVIEDDESMLEFCAAVLSLEGFEVVGVSNEAQARERLRGGAFDLVLTDHVAVAGSRSMASVVKSLSPRTRVIIMTGSPTYQDEMTALRDGASEYLVKPFRLHQLTSAIQKCA